MSKSDPWLMFASFPEHSKLIAHILAGWGDVLFELVMAASVVYPNAQTLHNLTWNIRTDSVRVDVLSAILLDGARSFGHGKEAEKAVQWTKAALNARNRYAHCHWYPTDETRTQILRVDWRLDYRKIADGRQKEIGEIVTVSTLKADAMKVSKAKDGLRALYEKLRVVAEQHHDLRLRLSEFVQELPPAPPQSPDARSLKSKRLPKGRTSKNDRDQ